MPPDFFPGRRRRKDLRGAILRLLAEEPMHGYQIMQELAERTDGRWQPSPGSVYPTLQQLEDEGLVRTERQGTRRIYSLTDEGAAAVEAFDTPPPWERISAEGDDELLDLRDLAFQVGAAVMQVAHAGSHTQIEKAKELLGETRRGLYRILADEDGAEAS